MPLTPEQQISLSEAAAQENWDQSRVDAVTRVNDREAVHQKWDEDIKAKEERARKIAHQLSVQDAATIGDWPQDRVNKALGKSPEDK